MMTNENEISYVIFDVFGTLIKFGTKHHPFRQLLKWARENGRQALSHDARTIMTINGGVECISQALGIRPPEELVVSMKMQIQDELSSLDLFDEVAFVIGALIQKGVRVGLCSNLAHPYGAAIDRLLPEFKVERFLSYELGFIKPEPLIYGAICDRFNCAPHQCLFVGDTLEADVIGPKKYGMNGLHLLRDEKFRKNQIKTLKEVPTYIEAVRSQSAKI